MRPSLTVSGCAKPKRYRYANSDMADLEVQLQTAKAADGRECDQDRSCQRSGAIKITQGFDVGVEVSGNQTALDQMIEAMVIGGRRKLGLI